MNLLAELLRHQRRRSDGTPTLTTLVGPRAAVRALLDEWTARNGWALLEAGAVEDVIGWLSPQRDRALACLLPTDARRLPEVIEITKAPTDVLPLRLEQALARRAPDEQAALRRWLTEDRIEDSDVPLLLRACALDRQIALLVQGPEVRATRFAVFMARRLPSLAVIFTADRRPDLAALPEPEARLLAENLLSLDPPDVRTPPAEVGPPHAAERQAKTGVNSKAFSPLPAHGRSRLETLLRRRGADHRVVELAREAWRARERLGADATPSRETIDAARSRAERLLFALLQEEPTTKGRFTLNAKLDVLFGRRPAEVDLLSTDLRIALEVDGYHHFRDATAYRRDRRKDVLLQTHGLRVVRVLADDVLERTEEVLDFIKDALPRRCEIG